jgi:predicted nucleic acid-binding protein
VIVLDTTITSELMKPSPSLSVVAWVRALPPAELYTTSITVAEILYGVERLPDGRRKDAIRSAAADVFTAFVEHILSFDARAAVEYVRIVSQRDLAGAPIDGFDAQIAAISRVHGAALATRNTKDFQNTGIKLIDPWRDEP